MESRNYKCKNCSSNMEYDDVNGVLRCPNCGYTEYLEESDEVKKERIRSKTAKEIEISKKKIEADEKKEEHKHELSKHKMKFDLVKLIIAILIVGILAFGVVKLINRISHIGDIKMPMSSKEYINLTYSNVNEIFVDLGFDEENITLIEDATLTKDKEDLNNIVYEISIDGINDFEKNIWFSKKSPIKIRYRSLDPKHIDDICLPHYDTNGINYIDALSIFKKAGFTDKNIKLETIEDLTLDDSKRDGCVDSITIDGKLFKNEANDIWVSNDSQIVIKYHVFDPERIKDISIKFERSDLLEKNYLDINNKLENYGFTNIYLMPIKDVGLFSKNENQVEDVSIDGLTSYRRNHLFAPNAEIIIKYHTKEFEYKDNDLDEVQNYLSDIGFKSIKINGLEDLQYDESKKANKVVDVLDSIDEKEIASLEKFRLQDEIVINYHSLIVKNNNNVQLKTSLKELEDMKYYDAKSKLVSLGFKNVSIKPLKDISDSFFGKIGQLLIKEDSIDEIVFGDDIDIKEDYFYDVNIPIVIKYHSKSN